MIYKEIPFIVIFFSTTSANCTTITYNFNLPVFWDIVFRTKRVNKFFSMIIYIVIYINHRLFTPLF